MHFCGNNLVIVRCILLEMHIVYIKKSRKGRRLCENTKGGHEPKTVEKDCIRRYRSLLHAAFSKWPPSRINCSLLYYSIISYRITEQIVHSSSVKSIDKRPLPVVLSKYRNQLQKPTGCQLMLLQACIQLEVWVRLHECLAKNDAANFLPRVHVASRG